MTQAALNPVVRSCGEGDAYWVLGDRYTFKVRSAETGGAYALLECEIAPNAGPPPHMHTREDEAFYILEGEVEFLLGDRTSVHGPGDYVFAPRGIPHTFKARDEGARMLVQVTPGAVEPFFVGIGTEAGGPDEASPGVREEDIQKVLELAPEYGIEILAPPPES